MRNKNRPGFEVLMQAFKESKGETVDLVIEHGEIAGVTLRMFHWWQKNHSTTTRDYRTWYPKDHILREWEVPPRGDSRIGAIVSAKEKIGEFPATVLRMRIEDPDLLPIRHKYADFGASSILGTDDKPIGWISHEREDGLTGLRMRSTFRFPAKTPQKFLDAMREHCKGEMGHFAEFLPGLYRKSQQEPDNCK